MTDPLATLAARLGGGPAELRETHISRVALAGEPGAGGVALKQCKPVDFGFVDLRTRDRRRAALEKERAVNARFAPGVYRGVIELPDGEPVLEMARLDEADTLEAKVKRGEATAADLDAVLDQLLPQFEQSERTPRWGDPAVIRQNLAENLDAMEQAERRFGLSLCSEALRSRQFGHLTALEPELRGRAAGGFVRDGHGDLRAEHIYFTADGVKALDGIAFGDRLRCVDVADEIAFLASDLIRIHPDRDGDDEERKDGWDDAFALTHGYLDRTDDPVSWSLIYLYWGYRLTVRAKVAALRALDGGPSADADFAEASERAHDAALLYLAADGRHTAGPSLVLFGGLSGSGKSTLAAAVAARLGSRHVSSDVVRKRLAGCAPADPLPAAAYTPAASRAVYEELAHATAGQDDVLQPSAAADATFRRRADREAFLTALSWTPTIALFVWCECDDAVAEARITQRAAEGTDASDATVAVRRKQAAACEPPTDAEFAGRPGVSLLRVDTDGPVEASADRVIDALRGLCRVADPAGVQ